MKSLKTFIIFLSTMLIVGSTFANAPTALLKLGDLLFNENALVKQLKALGVPEADAIRFSADAQTSLSAMMIKTKNGNTPVKNSKEVMQFVNSLNKTTIDPTVHLQMSLELQASLNKNIDGASQEDLMRTLSNLYYFAGNNGKKGSIISTCSGCTHDSAYKGLEHRLNSQKGSENLFERIINTKNQVTLLQEINQELKALKLPAIKPNTEDLRPIRLFLDLLNSGSDEQKAYVKAVLELGDINEHRLWDNPDLFNENPENLPGLIDLVKEISKYKKERGDDFEKSFNDVLSLRAGKDPDKRIKLTELMAKGCFLKRKPR